MKTNTKRRMALAGVNVACLIILGLTVGLVAALPAARAQGVETLVPVAVDIAEKLPTDVVRLCLTGIIIMALALVAVVLAFLRADAARVREFAATIREFGDKPCLMDSEQGLAIMRDRFDRVMRETRDARRLADG